MPTLNELMNKFASASGEDAAPMTSTPAARGTTKIASEGDKNMNSLQDIYLSISGMDHEKTAAAAANAPAPQAAEQVEGGDTDFAAMAEKLAAAEAEEQVNGGGGTGDAPDFMKVAAEYDSAGRIMARGFFDEFNKLAHNLKVAEDNQKTETESAAKTPALGERSLPTLETNYVGTVDTGSPGKQPQMNGSEPKKVYADSLAVTKTINAGATGDDPEALAMSLGGGSPVGFATVRDLQA